MAPQEMSQPCTEYNSFVSMVGLCCMVDDMKQDVLPPGEDTPWFEYKRIPLPW
jgi:hypothetical protein